MCVKEVLFLRYVCNGMEGFIEVGRGKEDALRIAIK